MIRIVKREVKEISHEPVPNGSRLADQMAVALRNAGFTDVKVIDVSLREVIVEPKYWDTVFHIFYRTPLKIDCMVGEEMIFCDYVGPSTYGNIVDSIRNHLLNKVRHTILSWDFGCRQFGTNLREVVESDGAVALAFTGHEGPGEVEIAVLHPQGNPFWVQAEQVELQADSGLATVEVWGYRFSDCEVRYSPSDRGEPETNYVVMKHPSGNWLRVWWLPKGR